MAMDALAIHLCLRMHSPDDSWSVYLEDADVRSSAFGFTSVEVESTVGDTAFLLPPSTWLLMSSRFSRLSLIPDHTPVPRNSSVFPAAYPTKSMVDLMVQYITMVGGAAFNSVVVVELRGRNAGLEEIGGTNPETMLVNRSRVRRKLVNDFAMMVLLLVSFPQWRNNDENGAVSGVIQNGGTFVSSRAPECGGGCRG